MSMHHDVAVIGAGPAGLSAALAAREQGARVVLIDSSDGLGGQIWRGADHPLIRRAAQSGITMLLQTTVFDCGASPHTLACEQRGRRIDVTATRLVVATGAAERFLPFPGWTLPGVTGAGGLQALIKSGFQVAGKRVVVAGSGPLLMVAAHAARRKGATLQGVFEQADPVSVAHFLQVLGPARLARAAALAAGAGRLPRTSSWVVRADGTERLEQVTVRTPRGSVTLACDVLATGFGLVPDTRLATLLGCVVDNGRVMVDGNQQTSVADVFAAGEPTGIGGADKALVEGRIAGRAAAGAQPDPGDVRSRERRARFQRALELAFRPRRELRELPDQQTLICRCEDVPFGVIAAARTGREARLMTRCGMGPCQGRICQPAIEFLTGEAADSVRPPLFPVTTGVLCQSSDG